MKPAIGTLVLALAIVGAAYGKSNFESITPKKLKAAGFAFEVAVTNMPAGAAEFRITVSEGGIAFTSPATALCVVEDGKNTKSVAPIRKLVHDKRRNSITCVFVVESALLRTQDCCFVFTNPVHRMPSADFVYARLIDFIPNRP
jgi:hypothetical protein